MLINLNEYNYYLPEELIALRPRKVRSRSKILIGTNSTMAESVVANLPSFLEPGDLLVFNNTKVIPARLIGVRRSRTEFGKDCKVSATLLNETSTGVWSALIKPKKRLVEGDVIEFYKENQKELLRATVLKKDNHSIFLDFKVPRNYLLTKLAKIGHMPIPPYVEKKRGLEDSDHLNYQSIFGVEEGAVAAPTASLHFDQALFTALEKRGVNTAFITLHVGTGTFLPLSDQQLFEQKLHEEFGKITKEVAAKINDTKKRGRRVVAIGTTVLRLLETAAEDDGFVKEFNSFTDLMIVPGYSFKICDMLLTNFHLPKSSLMMLVSSFHGHNNTKDLYAYAIKKGYQFYSFGDCMLVEKNK